MRRVPGDGPGPEPRIGLRVVMDVVYNHTNASGQSAKSRPRPRRPRLLPPPRRRRRGREQHLLREHRQRAQHDGEAADRLRGDLGEAVQGRRLPLRPDGPPHEAEHGRAAPGARRAHARNATASTAKAIYLYGEGWNFGEVADNARGVNATQRNMAGTGHRHLQRPPPRRRARRRPLQRPPGAGLPHRPLLRPQRHRPGLAVRAARPPAARYMDWIRVGLAGNLADYPFVDRFGNTVTGGQSTTTASPPATPRTRRRSSTTSRPTTTRRSSTPSSSRRPAADTLAERVRMQNLA